MHLHRGFRRLTFIASIIVGFAFASLLSKPSLDDFRWRAHNRKEAQKAEQAEQWFANHPNQSNPEMFVALGVNGRVPKEHQWFIPYEYGAVHFALPFIGGVVATWLIYALAVYLIRGFQA